MVLVLVWLVEQVSGFLDELYGVLYLCLVYAREWYVEAWA